MRDAFREWVDADMPATASVEVYYERLNWPAEKLLGQLSHCTEKMPVELCDELKMDHGRTYAAAGEQLLLARTAG